MASGSPSKSKKGRDFYKLLGLEKTANQGQIKHAYRKLAMKYHPDKNPGNEEPADKFKELSTAYAVLSDPNKKRQYDLHGEEGSVADLGSVNVEDLGTVGRLFGALVSKAGIPVPTEITQKVLTAAQHLGRGATSVPGFDLPHVETLIWGQSVSGTVERQTGHFFKLNITEEDLKNGVVISCTSNGSDKFKVVFFDNEGHVTMVEESQKRKRHSESNLYVVPFGRYNLSETMPMSMMRHLDEEVPPVFMILDTFDKDVKSLLPGSHLFCVYGDNWFQSVKYNLKCVVAISPKEDCVEKIKETERKLQEKKQHLETFQPDFCEVKKKYEEACKKLETDITETVELIEEREKAYNDYIARSSQKYSHVPPSKQHNGGGGAGGTSLLGGIGKLFG